jgi:CheY-like chemotaxis protein
MRKTHALVVDRDAHSLVAITTLLRELGVSFKRNTNGANVVGQIDAMSDKPDFILLNLDLPDDESFAICAEIRRSAAISDIPIIATTNDASPELMQRVQASGFMGLVPKPLPKKTFGSMVNKVLNGQSVYVVD